MKRLITNEELKQLIEGVTAENLDSTYLNYGDFSQKIKLNIYHPDYRDKMKPFENLYDVKIGSLIYNIFGRDSNAWEIALNEDQYNIFIAHINTLKKSIEFKKDIELRFNCYTYEVTFYSKDFLKFSRDEWWVTHSNSEVIPLNSSIKRDEELKKSVLSKIDGKIEHMKKNDLNVESWEIKKVYKLLHWRSNEEAKEIEQLVKKRTCKDNSPWFQASRWIKGETPSNGLDKVTLKSTGRKMLFRAHTYGFAYCELDPIVL